MERWSRGLGILGLKKRVEGFRGALAFGFKEEGLGFRGCRGFRV